MKIGLRILLGYFAVVGLAGWFLLNVFVEEVKPGVRDTLEDTLVDSANLLARIAAPDLKAGMLNRSAMAYGLADSTPAALPALISAVRGTLPDGVLIESATMKARAPWEPEFTPAGPLREPRVATLTFVISSPTILDATAIVRSLVDVPGFADATPDSVTEADGIYSTTVTLNVNEKALANRFADDTKEASK